MVFSKPNRNQTKPAVFSQNQTKLEKSIPHIPTSDTKTRLFKHTAYIQSLYVYIGVTSIVLNKIQSLYSSLPQLSALFWAFPFIIRIMVP